MSNQGFNIVEQGFWPRETYSVSPILTAIPLNLGLLPYQNTFHQLKNNYLQLESLTASYWPFNSIIGEEAWQGDISEAVDFKSNQSKFVINTSAFRVYDLGSYANFFKINLNDLDTNEELIFDDIVYGYLFYPKRLFLKPVSAQKINASSYKLTCSAVLIKPTVINFKNPVPERKTIVPQLHETFLNNPPQFEPLKTSKNNECILFYGLSSTQTYINRSILNYRLTQNNNTFSFILEKNSYNNLIRKDFTFLSYVLNYITFDRFTNLPYLETFDTYYYDTPNVGILPFSRPIRFSYNPQNSSNLQTFYIVQSAISYAGSPGTLLPLQDPRNSIFYVDLNLQTTNIKHKIKQFRLAGSLYNAVTGQYGTKFTVSYINDSSNLKHTTEPVQGTLTNFYVHGDSSLSLGSSVSSTIIKCDTVTFTTKHPPHYYAYNLAMEAMPSNLGIQKDFTIPTEINNLTFHLSSFPINRTASSVFVSTYLYSDFNCLTLDLPTYAINDKIKYVQQANDDFLVESISAFTYPNGIKTYYDFNNPSWLDAGKNSVLEITYPSSYQSTVDFTIRATLSTLAGNKDAIKNSQIPLIGLYTQPVYPLFLEEIKQGDDFIDVTAESLTSIFVYPGVDLRETNISWTIYPNDNNYKLNYLLKDSTGTYNPIDFLTKNSSINFDSSSWAVRVSGYGPTPISITLSSQKNNNYVTLSSDPAFFNFFTEERIIIGQKIPYNNLLETRTVTLTAGVPYKGRLYNLPENIPIFWSWTYNNNTITPLITALYTVPQFLNENYEAGENSNSQNLSSLKFLINPIQTADTPKGNNIKIKCYTTDTILPYEDTFQFVADDFPTNSIFNSDFDIRYRSFPAVKILDTRNNQFVLTRPDTGTSKYTLRANTDVIPLLNSQNYRWSITKSDVASVSTVNGLTAINLDTDGTYETTVTFTAISAVAPGWSYPHNISKTVTIYTIDNTDFNTSPSFIIYPQFAWQNEKLEILDDSNFKTYAASTSSYGYKKTSSEFYYISTFPTYTKYNFSYGYAKEPLTTSFVANKGIIEIPYNTQFYSNTGVTLQLTAFNIFYPEGTPLRYQIVEGSSLVTRNYKITAQTVPYNVGINPTLRFSQNPKLMDYNSISHTFTAAITSFDLDVERVLYVEQRVETNPKNTAAFPVKDISTITYILSTPQWKAYKNVPALNGRYSLFTLKVGDEYNPLTLNASKYNTLRLNASANLNIKIPQETFSNYAYFEYKENRDLWDTKNIVLTSDLSPISKWKTLVAYSTSISPQIYFSTYYTITGFNVFVEFDTPDYQSNPITSYSVNFGDNYVLTQNKNTTFNHQYSSIGTFFITYSAIREDSSYTKYFAQVPFIIKEKWPEYNQENIRILNETVLNLPYTLDEVAIQPNEFGDNDIFNTAITRLDECLEYLKSNTQTMNIDAPIAYYGWLGSNIENLSDGIRWYTSTYGSEFYNLPNNSINSGKTYFEDIRSIRFDNLYIYVLDNKKFRVFDKSKNANEILFDNAAELDGAFADPKSIAISENNQSIYVADSIRHKVYRFDFDFTVPNKPIFSLVLTLGSFGGLNDNNRFDYPSELQYASENLYVLDYNNNCIKQYNKDLSWIHTYYDDLFASDQIQNIAIHPTRLLYVLGKSLKVYIFDILAENSFKTFDLPEISVNSEVKNIFFDDAGEFLYVATDKNIFKYTAIGEYVTFLTLPQNSLTFVSADISENKSINFASKNSILRFQDFVDIYKIGEGLSTSYWSLKQMLLNKEEFAQDLNYNAALIKVAQNLKTFRTSLNSKFALVTEQTPKGTVTYFSIIPINVEDRIVFEDDIELERLRIGTNEFHIPSVINRELTKLYNALLQSTSFLNIIETNTDSSSTNNNGESGCTGSFCWSWKAMSCYNLSLPIIRLCNINPITYAELVNTFPINYAPTKKWGEAYSNCCSDYVSPLDK